MANPYKSRVRKTVKSTATRVYFSLSPHASHCKKRVTIFPVPSRDVTRDGKIVTLFYSAVCHMFGLPHLDDGLSLSLLPLLLLLHQTKY
jgi:hypothetical protein